MSRVEQTETPDMMQERVKGQRGATKYDKVVSREVCQVVNKGTQVFGQQVDITNDYQPNYMMAIAHKVWINYHRIQVKKINENHFPQNIGENHSFGVCFIDTSIGEFTIGQFDDDKHCSRLLTLLSHNPPVLVLHERVSMSPRLTQIFKTALCNTLKEALNPDTQFWSAEKTLKTLAEKYFGKKEKIEWPAIIRMTQDGGDHLGLTPNSSYNLALRAMGSCLWYLSRCLIDQQIMDMARFSVYTPPDLIEMPTVEDLASQLAKKNFNKHMVLDSITLSNLKVLDDECSLYQTLDQCCTKFGKRLLHYWVCSPSCERTVVVDRQNAVRELMENTSALNEARLIMGSLPDLERQLAQIHTFGNANKVKNHPDGRAILFEQKQYNKKKIQVNSFLWCLIWMPPPNVTQNLMLFEFFVGFHFDHKWLWCGPKTSINFWELFIKAVGSIDTVRVGRRISKYGGNHPVL